MLEDGKIGVVAEQAFIDSLDLRVHPASDDTKNLTDLIETVQYLKASWFNELGLNANYNMKRESINSGESQLNDDALLPLVDDMLRRRQEGAEEVNALFGTEISVELASAWEDNAQEIEAEQNALESESKEDKKDDVDSEKAGRTDPEPESVDA